MNKILMIAVLALVAATPAVGQVPVPAEEPLVNAYIADYAQERPAWWWRALGQQLVLGVERPVEQVPGAALQNIIFFATNHRDKIDFRGVVQPLIRIYESDAPASYRIMAVAALHAIGDRQVIRLLAKRARKETSARVRKITLAAAVDLNNP